MTFHLYSSSRSIVLFVNGNKKEYDILESDPKTLPPLLRRIQATLLRKDHLIERSFGIRTPNSSSSRNTQEEEIKWERANPERNEYEVVFEKYVKQTPREITAWKATVVTYCYAESLSPEKASQIYFFFHDWLMDQTKVFSIRSQRIRESAQLLLEWFTDERENKALESCAINSPKKPNLILGKEIEIIRMERVEEFSLETHEIQPPSFDHNGRPTIWMKGKCDSPYTIFQIKRSLSVSPITIFAAQQKACGLREIEMNIVWDAQTVTVFITHEALLRIVTVEIPMLELTNRFLPRKRRERPWTPFIAAAFRRGWKTEAITTIFAMLIQILDANEIKIDKTIIDLCLNIIVSETFIPRLQQAYREEMNPDTSEFETGKPGLIAAIYTFCVSNPNRAITKEGIMKLTPGETKEKLIRMLSTTAETTRAPLVVLTPGQVIQVYTEATKNIEIFQTLHTMKSNRVRAPEQLHFTKEESIESEDAFEARLNEIEQLLTMNERDRGKENPITATRRRRRIDIWEKEIAPGILAKYALLNCPNARITDDAFGATHPDAAACMLVHPINHIRLPNPYIDSTDVRDTWATNELFRENAKRMDERRKKS